MIWVTKDGERIRISNMTDRHLLNAHRFVCNQIVRIQEATESFFHPVFGPSEGSMAEFYAEREMEEVWDRELYLLKWRGVFEKEIKRRGLHPLSHRKRRSLPSVELVETNRGEDGRVIGRIFKLGEKGGEKR